MSVIGAKGLASHYRQCVNQRDAIQKKAFWCRRAGAYAERDTHLQSAHVCHVLEGSHSFGWRFGVVVSVVDRINEVNQHRAWLVP